MLCHGKMLCHGFFKLISKMFYLNCRFGLIYYWEKYGCANHMMNDAKLFKSPKGYSKIN